MLLYIVADSERPEQTLRAFVTKVTQPLALTFVGLLCTITVGRSVRS